VRRQVDRATGVGEGGGGVEKKNNYYACQSEAFGLAAVPCPRTEDDALILR